MKAGGTGEDPAGGSAPSAPQHAGLRRVAWAVLSYGSGAAVLKGVTFLVSIWLARMLAPASYGLWGLALALQGGLVSGATVGLYEAAAGRLRLHPDDGTRATLSRDVERAFALLLGLATVVVLGIGALLSSWGDIGPLSIVAAVGSGAALAFATLRGQMLNFAGRHRLALRFLFLVPVMGLAAGVAAVGVWRSPEAYFAGGLAGSSLGIALLLRGHSQAPSGQGWPAAGDLLRAAAPYSLAGVFGWLSGYGANLLVYASLDAAQVARFTFALNMGAVLQMAATAMNQAWSPRFFARVHVLPQAELERENLRFFSVTGTLMGVAAFVGLLALPVALRWVGGLAFYEGMQAEVALVCLGYIALCPFWHAQNYFYAHGSALPYARIMIGSGLLGLALWVVAIHVLGPMGVYGGFTLLMAIRSAWAMVEGRRRWGLRSTWISVVPGWVLCGAGYAVGRML